ncbi:hypothetical protein DZA50_06060 [Kangiella sp. HD9-110m-PIT-SAG07]|nr:hypothetical protein DZA50_06060 [Kangiella sp. HD9-110m-PIT-SAG07]
MIKALTLCLVFYLFSAPSYGGSANVKVTIKIPTAEQEAKAVRLYNYKLNRYQIIRDPFDLNREDCLAYLPQNHDTAIQILDLHINQGREPYRALRLTFMGIS